MRRKRRLYVWVTVGFLILYLVIMGACTFLIRAKYMVEFAQDFQTQLSGVADFIEQDGGGEGGFHRRVAPDGVSVADILRAF